MAMAESRINNNHTPTHTVRCPTELATHPTAAALILNNS